MLLEVGREGGREGRKERKGRGIGGKVFNRVCRLVNITLTRSVVASGIFFPKLYLFLKKSLFR